MFESNGIGHSRYRRYAGSLGLRSKHFTVGRTIRRMLPSLMKRLKQLEEENAKLKKFVADQSLDKLVLRYVLTKNPKDCRKAVSRAVPAKAF